VIYVDADRCTGCGACMGICPCGAIAIENGIAIIAGDLCDECGDCLDACSSGAIVLVEPATVGALDRTQSQALSSTTVYPGHRQTLVPRQWAPSVESALQWAQRELMPRLAGLALDWIDRRRFERTRIESAATQSRGPTTIPVGFGTGPSGRRRRERRRQGGGQGISPAGQGSRQRRSKR
jgi:ferredoxin